VQAYQSTRAVTTNEKGEKAAPPTAAQAVKEIVKQDGVKGLWRGLGPALILVINPVIQVSWLCCSALDWVLPSLVLFQDRTNVHQQSPNPRGRIPN
jgi:hypothetical protein